MEQILLRSYETFAEFPDGYLYVSDKTNLVYITDGNNAFVAREFIDYIEVDNLISNYSISYYNVKNNEKVLTIKIERNILDGNIITTNISDEISITPLNDILKLNQDGINMICLEDINTLIDFYEGSNKCKKNSII